MKRYIKRQTFTYDANGIPWQTYFTNSSVTKYVYGASETEAARYTPYRQDEHHKAVLREASKVDISPVPVC